MKKVTLYSLSTCPWCKKAKTYFERRGLDYECIDYDHADYETQEKIYRDMHDIGVGSFPLVKIGTDVVAGYKPDQYEELLKQGSTQ